MPRRSIITHVPLGVNGERGLELLQKRRFRRRISALFSLCLCAALSLTAQPSLAAKESKDSSPGIEAEIEQMLSSEEEKEQAQHFSDMVSSRFNYVTSQSLCGKSGNWLAFVDVYEIYDDGKPTGQHVLQRATVQYGLDTLPNSAKATTLTIGSDSSTVKASKDTALFSFPTIPVLELKEKATASNAKLSVDAGKQSTSINLTPDYPHKSFEAIEDVLAAMAPAYIDYAQKKDGSFDHAFLLLRSYVEDSDNMTRIYSWELKLVQKDTLPSKAIVIRYDCDTKNVAPAVNREIRSYFVQ